MSYTSAHSAHKVVRMLCMLQKHPRTVSTAAWNKKYEVLGGTGPSCYGASSSRCITLWFGMSYVTTGTGRPYVSTFHTATRPLESAEASRWPVGHQAKWMTLWRWVLLSSPTMRRDDAFHKERAPEGKGWVNHCLVPTVQWWGVTVAGHLYSKVELLCGASQWHGFTTVGRPVGKDSRVQQLRSTCYTCRQGVAIILGGWTLNRKGGVVLGVLGVHIGRA